MSSSPTSGSPNPFSMSSTADYTSTAASSPPPSGALTPNSEVPVSIENLEFEARYDRLTFLLSKSAAYAKMLQTQMESSKKHIIIESPAKSTKKQTRRNRGKRLRIDEDSEDEAPCPSKRQKMTEEDTTSAETTDAGFRQPSLVTGAQLKDYQLEGVQWMISLDQNGISGILADEMGLGKTLQTIAFHAYLRETGYGKPFLIVCPLSVLHNWVEEFAKFAPTVGLYSDDQPNQTKPGDVKIPVCMYHGSPAERAELRRTVMSLEDKEVKKSGRPKGKGKTGAPATSSKVSEKPRPKVRGNGKTRGRPLNGRSRGGASNARRSSQPGRKPIYHEETEEEETKEEVDPVVDDAELEDADEPEMKREKEEEEKMSTFPVVITTYEMIINDRIHLSKYNWGYIVVDEGHRLKNLDCRLMQEIKKYDSAGRMILTGTPLHNNLAELWSLLNFILPDIFNDIASFQEWFNLPTLQSTLSSEQSASLIHSLHAILKPFLLRRMKADVIELPPKKEYVLYAPLSKKQREVYESVLEGETGLRSYLLGKGKGKETLAAKQEDVNKIEVDVDDSPRKLRSKGKGKNPRRDYTIEDDDEAYFKLLESGEGEEARRRREREKENDIERIGLEHQRKAAVKLVNNMKLQNTVMQLRKVCSHPFLFDWPLDPITHQPMLDEEIVNASGKMMVLDRLLGALFAKRHKVLLFSQFTTMLDIVEDWARELKGWRICRIDGSTAPLERREQMNEFQQGGDAADAPHLFLLSTRAGGLGVNLTAADTVIFYDQDWNPQMDIQAQDRAHRIGQTKPVLIFRLVSAHSIETRIMQRATEKRKLEALVIAKGKFKMPARAAGSKPETMAEMAAALLRLEGEQVDVLPNAENVLSDTDLDMLLDRSPEVFTDRGKGWASTGEDGVGGQNGGQNGGKAAFEVFQAPADEGNEALARMLGEDDS